MRAVIRVCPIGENCPPLNRPWLTRPCPHKTPHRQRETCFGVTYPYHCPHCVEVPSVVVVEKEREVQP